MGGELVIAASNNATFSSCALTDQVTIVSGSIALSAEAEGECSRFVVTSGSVAIRFGGTIYRLPVGALTGLLCGEGDCYRAEIDIAPGTVTVEGGDSACVALLDDVPPDNGSDGLSWTQTTDTAELGAGELGCVARSGAEVVYVIQDQIDLPGGRLHVRDSPDSWTEIDFSDARANMTCLGSDERAYITGGTYSTPGGDELTTTYGYAHSDGSLTNLELRTSAARARSTMALCGDNLVVGGGYPANQTGTGSNHVDIHNLLDQTTTTAFLSELRRDMSAAVVGTEVFFAGGIIEGSWDNDFPTSSALVLNCEDNSWSTSEMPGYWGQMRPTGVALSDGLYFAGDTYEANDMIATLDGAGPEIAIYTPDDQSWATLAPVGLRTIMAFAASEDYLFAVGLTPDIPSVVSLAVYDRSDETWALAELTDHLSVFGVFVFESQVVVAGRNNQEPGVLDAAVTTFAIP